MTRLLCVNNSGEQIPAGGCFRLNAVSGTAVRNNVKYGAIKPDGDDRFYYINGPVPVSDTRTLYAEQTSEIVRALVDWGDPVEVAFGDEVGPSANSWQLSNAGTGFYVIGEIGTDGLTPVIKVSSGGAGIYAAGYATNARCASGLIDVTVYESLPSPSSALPGDVYNGVISDVQDTPRNLLAGLTLQGYGDADINGKFVDIVWYVNEYTQVGAWKLVAIYDVLGCDT